MLLDISVCNLQCIRPNANFMILVTANFRKFKEKMVPKNSPSEDKQVNYYLLKFWTVFFHFSISLTLFFSNQKSIWRICAPKSRSVTLVLPMCIPLSCTKTGKWSKISQIFSADDLATKDTPCQSHLSIPSLVAGTITIYMYQLPSLL